MIQFEIFFGGYSSECADCRASDYLNEWITDHPNAKIIDWQYQQARYGDHSICIRYVDRAVEDGE